MMKFILIAAIAWLVGVWGWAQIIGSIQNVRIRKNLWFTLLLWTIIMVAGAYLAIVVFDSVWALVIGYGISFVQIICSGRIK